LILATWSIFLSTFSIQELLRFNNIGVEQTPTGPQFSVIQRRQHERGTITSRLADLRHGLMKEEDLEALTDNIAAQSSELSRQVELGLRGTIVRESGSLRETIMRESGNLQNTMLAQTVNTTQALNHLFKQTLEESDLMKQLAHFGRGMEALGRLRSIEVAQTLSELRIPRDEAKRLRDNLPQKV